MEKQHPLKTFLIKNSGTFTTRHLEIHLLQNAASSSNPILWVNTKSPFLESPQVNIHQSSKTGPIVASAKLRGMSKNLRIHLGPAPEATPKELWNDVVSESWTSKAFSFPTPEGRFLWKRTHDKALGASRMGNQDFKLVDANNTERVLAVYIKDRKWLSGGEIGKIEWFVEMGMETEVCCLIAILGIEERVRRANSSSGSGGGGGGGC